MYARPAHADVAEFMGYRNLLPSRASGNGDGRMTVTFGNANLIGTPIEAVGSGDATIAIRPDDLTPSADAPISAVVETAEYRGRDFYGTARTSDNVELFFRSDRKVASGETVRLGADPTRVLVYARGVT